MIAENSGAVPAAFTQAGAATGAGWATPAALLFDLARTVRLTEQLGQNVWETTMRVLTADGTAATGAILEWEIMDDAIAGVDHRATMRFAGGTWFLERLQRREHCRRGVSTEGLCV